MHDAEQNEERPGTKTNDPAEGKRTDVRATPASAYPADMPEQPGTKTAPPAEGGDDVSGAGKPADSRQ